MSRKLLYDIPGREFRIELGEGWDWEQSFGDDLGADFPRVLEIGYGRGEFLMSLGEANPKTAFLGIEVSFKRSLKMARRLARSELSNVRIVCATAQDVMADIPRGSVEACWVNYPDPWPKTRHAKHRLLQPAFAEQWVRLATPGGILNIATDDRAYAEQVARVFGDAAELENLYAPDLWRPEVEGRMATAYELEWRAEGRALHYFSFQRRGCA